MPIQDSEAALSAKRGSDGAADEVTDTTGCSIGKDWHDCCGRDGEDGGEDVLSGEDGGENGSGGEDGMFDVDVDRRRSSSSPTPLSGS